MCAELSGMIPSNHGSIAWVYRGLGSFWGFLYSVNDCSSTLIDTPTYIVLIGTYSQDWLNRFFNVSNGSVSSEIICYIFKSLLILIAASLNMFNITVIGNTSIILSILIMLPLLIGFIVILPDININVWFDDKTIDNCDNNRGVCDWPLFISTVICLHTGWDVTSHIAGEVGFEFSTIMKSFMWANVLDLVSYLIPLFTIFTIAYPKSNNYNNISKWEDGYLIDAYYEIGSILGLSIYFGSILSNYSIHLCEISTLCREIWALAQPIVPKSKSNLHLNLDEIPIAVLPNWMGKVWNRTQAPYIAILLV